MTEQKLKTTKDNIKRQVADYKDTIKDTNTIFNKISKEFDPEKNEKVYDTWGKYDYEKYLDDLIDDFNIFYNAHNSLLKHGNNYFDGIYQDKLKPQLNFTIDRINKLYGDTLKINKLPNGAKLVNKTTLKDIEKMKNNTENLKNIIQEYDNENNILNDYLGELDKV